MLLIDELLLQIAKSPNAGVCHWSPATTRKEAGDSCRRSNDVGDARF